MCDSTSNLTDEANSTTHFERELCGGAEQPYDRSQSGFEPEYNNEDTHSTAFGQGNLVERLSRYGARALLVPASIRRSRLHRQEVVEPGSASRRLSVDTTERGSLTPAMRKRYLKELLLNNPSNSGLNNVLSSESSSVTRYSDQDVPDGASWALYPMEHAWMLSAVDGNYETIIDYLSEDPYLLTRKDFVSGYSVLHWLAKGGQDETLINLLKYAEKMDIPVSVNLKGSGGLTPLHVAALHSQYMVIKILVGAFGANIDAMDYNGKRAWQYLKENVPIEIKELLGAWDDDHSVVGSQNTNNNATQSITPEINEEKDEVDSCNRNHRAGSWRFGSFKKLKLSFSFFGYKR